MTAWVNPSFENLQGGVIFCSSGAEVAGLCFGTSGELSYKWGDSAHAHHWDTRLFPKQNEWTFVALVITPTRVTIYMQPDTGKLRHVSHDIADRGALFQGDLVIGRDPIGKFSPFFSGLLDEVRIYNVALSTPVISALASPGALTFP
jgi:hypothetical protein